MEVKVETGEIPSTRYACADETEDDISEQHGYDISFRCCLLYHSFLVLGDRGFLICLRQKIQEMLKYRGV